MIRPAEPQDLSQLTEMARRFVAETALPLTFDEELTRQTFWDAINSDAILLVDEHEDVLAGAIMGFVDRDFTVEKTAFITKFYVEKEFRGLRVSQDLLKSFIREVKYVKIIYASATAGMGERVEKMYVRLFEKQGFQVLGRVLLREL